MEQDQGQGCAPMTDNPTTALSPVTTEDVPEPGEDDLDDLDDMLDQFSATKLNAPKDSPQKPEAHATETVDEPDMSDEATIEFSKQLQEQMAALMGDSTESPGMKREIEGMMRERGAAADPGAPQDAPPLPNGEPNAHGQSGSSEEAFQETIRRTMERMQTSGEQSTTAAAHSEDSDEMLANLLKEMQNSGLEGGGDEEGINKMLLGIMEELTNKDILYEPMKELHDKFPAWMTKNRSQTKADDLKRYEEQQKLVAEIVRKFERRGYSDTKAEDRSYIVERMQQMQAAGSPPSDLVGDMNVAQDILGEIGSGCPIQ